MNPSRSEEFLEHYGVPGMKWGVRKASTSKSRTPEQKREQRIKTMKRAAAVGVAVGVGALVAHRVVSQKGSVKVSSVSKVKSSEVDRMLKAATKQRQNTPKPKAWAMPPVPPKPKATMSKSSTKWLAEVTAKQNSLISAANADLKAGYERLQTPLPQREYLKPWD